MSENLHHCLGELAWRASQRIAMGVRHEIFGMLTPGQHPMHVGQVQQVAGFGFGCWGGRFGLWLVWVVSLFLCRCPFGTAVVLALPSSCVQKGVNKRDASRHKSEDTFGTTHI